MANQGIMHLSRGKSGDVPVCNTRRSIMSMNEAEFREWPLKCKRCEARLAKRDAKKAAKSFNISTCK